MAIKQWLLGVRSRLVGDLANADKPVAVVASKELSR